MGSRRRPNGCKNAKPRQVQVHQLNQSTAKQRPAPGPSALVLVRKTQAKQSAGRLSLWDQVTITITIAIAKRRIFSGRLFVVACAFRRVSTYVILILPRVNVTGQQLSRVTAFLPSTKSCLCLHLSTARTVVLLIRYRVCPNNLI